MKKHSTSLPAKLSVLSFAGCLLSALASAALAAPSLTIRASVSSSGEEGNAGSETYSGSSLSANGRFVAFESDASNLVAGDNNNARDIFVHDRKKGLTQRVSVDSAEIEGNDASYDPAISSNGRFVAFQSDAGNLVAGDNNNTGDVFVRDLKKGVTQRVSVDSAGTEGNGSSGNSAISSNGRFVAFVSSASNLVEGEIAGWTDIFVRDIKKGVTQRVSVDSAGKEGNNGSFDTPAISANGRFVAFSSLASNLVEGDNNDTYDIFVRDIKKGVTQRVSVDSSGAEAKADYGNGCYNGFADSTTPSISANGRFVAFASQACNLVAGDTNNENYYFGTDIFVHDTETGMTQRASVDSSGGELFGGNSINPSISANGRFVAFSSNFGGHSTAYHTALDVTKNIVVRDLNKSVTEIVSDLGDENIDLYSYGSFIPSISGNGRYVAFYSDFSTLVTGDSNGAYDVFVRRWW